MGERVVGLGALTRKSTQDRTSTSFVNSLGCRSYAQMQPMMNSAPTADRPPAVYVAASTASCKAKGRRRQGQRYGGGGSVQGWSPNGPRNSKNALQ